MLTGDPVNRTPDHRYPGRIDQIRSLEHKNNFDMTYSLYALSGFCVGVLVGLTGVGGGSLMTPLLVLLFGVHPTTAVGTDLLFAASTKTLGTLLHGLSRNIDWRLVGLLAAGSVPSTTLTLLLLAHLDLGGGTARQLITVALGVALLLTATFLLLARSIRTAYADRIGRLDGRVVTLLTFALGVTMGVLVTTTCSQSDLDRQSCRPLRRIHGRRVDQRKRIHRKDE